jgi:ribosomal protein S18 acetylase RimI-like enzyme
MEIFAATHNDLFEAMFLVSTYSGSESEKQYTCWGAVTPGEENLKNGIAAQNLYIARDKVVLGMAILTKLPPILLKLSQKEQEKQSLYAHCFSVHSLGIGKGVVRQLLDFGISKAREQGCEVLRIDVRTDHLLAEEQLNQAGFKKNENLKFNVAKVHYVVYEYNL